MPKKKKLFGENGEGIPFWLGWLHGVSGLELNLWGSGV